MMDLDPADATTTDRSPDRDIDPANDRSGCFARTCDTARDCSFLLAIDSDQGNTRVRARDRDSDRCASQATSCIQGFTLDLAE